MSIPSTHIYDIHVKPSNRIFEELGNNSYDFLDVISELIDNSLSAHSGEGVLQVDIEIALSKKRENSYFKIRDNACGMEI